MSVIWAILGISVLFVRSRVTSRVTSSATSRVKFRNVRVFDFDLQNP